MAVSQSSVSLSFSDSKRSAMGGQSIWTLLAMGQKMSLYTVSLCHYGFYLDTGKWMRQLTWGCSRLCAVDDFAVFHRDNQDAVSHNHKLTLVFRDWFTT
eukprot:c5882_g1_i1 orf=288-584(+)